MLFAEWARGRGQVLHGSIVLTCHFFTMPTMFITVEIQLMLIMQAPPPQLLYCIYHHMQTIATKLIIQALHTVPPLACLSISILQQVYKPNRVYPLCSIKHVHAGSDKFRTGLFWYKFEKWRCDIHCKMWNWLKLLIIIITRVKHCERDWNRFWVINSFNQRNKSP